MNAMSRVRVAPGEVVIRQGATGDKFYIIERGSCNIVIGREQVGTIDAAGAFGELALLYGCPRAATIVAAEACVLWALNRTTFRRLLATTSSSSMAERCAFLKNVPLLQNLSNLQISKLGGALRSLEARAGTYIVTQGEAGDTFYIIKSGDVVATEIAENKEVEIGRLSTGDYFGEMSLLHNDRRHANCIASTDVELLSLDRESFNSLLGPLKALLEEGEAKRNAEMEAAVRQAGGGGGAGDGAGDGAAAEASHPAHAGVDKTPLHAMKLQGDTSIEFRDLTIMRTLGTGTFGRVKMVQHNPTRRVMALKCMQKAQVVASHQQLNVCSEKNVMLLAEHPFVLKLFRTFQDRDCLYMLLELVQGGELWTLLYQNQAALPRCSFGGFEIPTARFYAACVIDAFEHVHEMSIAYRDLKPENLLVDNMGYLKVVDFGFAKQVPFLKNGRMSDRSYTLCGTPEYLSPELVLSKGHDKSVDYWALGVLIYELIVGGTPFADPSQPRIFEKIIHSKRFLRFPRDFDFHAEDLIRKLLEPNPAMRFGNLAGAVAEIKSHLWFTGSNFDWGALNAKTLPAPYVPNIKNPLDASNFDPYPEDDRIQPYRDTGKGWFDNF